jgi:thiol-disulfide isomerase/thioredoxin
MEGLRTDAELTNFINSSNPGVAVVEYGTSWCHKCHEMFPTFYALSKKVSQRMHAVPDAQAVAATARTWPVVTTHDVLAAISNNEF